MNDLMMLIHELVDEGIEVTLRKDSRGFHADLNSGTKSGMYLFGDPDGGLVVCCGRYDENDVVNDLKDLAWIFVERYRDRDYGSQAWLDLAVRRGVMQRKVHEVVTYE